MTVLRRVAVRSHPALLLRAASHPGGGVHGGHVAVVWNQRRHGYVFSIHAAHTGRITPQDEAVALDGAEAMARTP